MMGTTINGNRISLRLSSAVKTFNFTFNLSQSSHVLKYHNIYLNIKCFNVTTKTGTNPLYLFWGWHFRWLFSEFTDPGFIYSHSTVARFSENCLETERVEIVILEFVRLVLLHAHLDVAVHVQHVLPKFWQVYLTTLSWSMVHLQLFDYMQSTPKSDKRCWHAKTTLTFCPVSAPSRDIGSVCNHTNTKRWPGTASMLGQRHWHLHDNSNELQKDHLLK